jgi:hypothetical protein
MLMPAAMSSSRTSGTGGPILAMPSPERSTSRRSAASGAASSRRRAACSASPIAVSPFELRCDARTLAAKAAAPAASPMRVQPTVTICLSRSDHSSTAASMAPCRPAPIAAATIGSSKARAIPSCCRMYSPASTLSETSTAMTRARSTGCAAAPAGRPATASAAASSSEGSMRRRMANRCAAIAAISRRRRRWLDRPRDGPRDRPRDRAPEGGIGRLHSGRGSEIVVRSAYPAEEAERG